MLTGENFIRCGGDKRIKELKEKIANLKNQCGEIENINNIRENGFDEVKHDKLSKKIEWLEYLLWGLTEK